MCPPLSLFGRETISAPLFRRCTPPAVLLAERVGALIDDVPLIERGNRKDETTHIRLTFWQFNATSITRELFRTLNSIAWHEHQMIMRFDGKT